MKELITYIKITGKRFIIFDENKFKVEKDNPLYGNDGFIQLYSYDGNIFHKYKLIKCDIPILFGDSSDSDDYSSLDSETILEEEELISSDFEGCSLHSDDV